MNKENNIVCESSSANDSIVNEVEKSYNGEISDDESECEKKRSIKMSIYFLEYCKASEWLYNENYLEANDLLYVFKYSDDLYELNEMSLYCDCIIGNADCFNEYKGNEFKNLTKISISCIIIILIINL